MILPSDKIETPDNINDAFETILNTQPDLTVEEAVKLSGTLSAHDLFDRLEALAPELDVWGLRTIPITYKSQLEEIARSIEAQNSIRKLAAESSAIPLEMPLQASEIPMIQDEPLPQPQSGQSAIAQTESGQIAQGHAEQEAETIELEEIAQELALGGKLEAIQAGIQDADTLAADYENAFRQQFAFRKAEMWQRFGQQQTRVRMQATNTNLATPIKAANLRQQLTQQQADFLNRDQAIKTAWENRITPVK